MFIGLRLIALVRNEPVVEDNGLQELLPHRCAHSETQTGSYMLPFAHASLCHQKGVYQLKKE